MPRTYIPTGRPRGRPKFDPNAPVKAIVPKALMFHPVDVSDIADPEKKMRAALSQLMGGMHSQMPAALQAAAEKKPELVVQFYRDLIEYLAPKLSRLEQSGTVNLQHQHFVAVEERENDPRKPPIDSTAVEVLGEANA